MSTISLESFFTERLPLQLPELRRKHIVRVRGKVTKGWVVKAVKTHYLIEIENVAKPFCIGTRTTPAIGQIVEIVATEGAVWHFVKWWTPIEPSKYRLRSNPELEQLTLEVLAGSPDERITADDLHTPEIEALMKEKNRDPRVLGSTLVSLLIQGIIKATGAFIPSRRGHHRRVCVWTWNS